MIRKESGMYEPIQKWLRTQGYESRDGWINKGESKYRVDVVGIRNTGNWRYDDIEIVAVEAKMWGNYMSLGQAENYRDVAHKVYFATTSEDKVKKLKEGCVHKNLGFLLVDKRSKRVTEYLGASVIKPRSEAATLEFLRIIDIGRCTLCQCYIDLSGDKRKEVDRLSRWTKFNKKNTWISRYLCKDCQKYLNKESEKIDDKYDWKIGMLDKREQRHRIKYDKAIDCVVDKETKHIKKIDKKYDEWCRWLEKQIKEIKRKV